MTNPVASTRRRIPPALRVAVILLCVTGVFAAAQRTVIAIRNDAPGSDGLPPIVRGNVEALAGISGYERGSPRYRELVAGSSEFETKYRKYRAVILLHVVPGGLILLLAPFKFSDRIRRRYTRYHRIMGRVLLVSVGVSGMSAFFFGLLMPFGGPLEAVGIMVFGALFLYAGARAYAAIRRRDVTTHREWMTRMFAVAVGISAVRLVSLPLSFVPLSMKDGFVLSIWIGFSLSVGVAEMLIRRARPRRIVTPARAAMAADTA